MSQQTGSNVIRLAQPGAGQRVIVAVNANDMRLSLGFEPDPNAVQKNGQNLEFSFEDGGMIVLEGYYDHFADKTLPVMVTENGDELPGEDFLASLREDLLTAAGPGAGVGVAGGGMNDYADNAGNLVAGIDRLGSLGTDYWGGAAETPEFMVSAALDAPALLTITPFNPELPAGPDDPFAPGLSLDGTHLTVLENQLHADGSQHDHMQGESGPGGTFSFIVASNDGLAAILIDGVRYDLVADPDAPGQFILQNLDGLADDSGVGHLHNGRASLNPDGTYRVEIDYTLDSAYLGHTEDGVEKDGVGDFVIAAVGNSGAQSDIATVTVDVVDDIATAYDDTANVGLGVVDAMGNVLPNDDFGADGRAGNNPENGNPTMVWDVEGDAPNGVSHITVTRPGGEREGDRVVDLAWNQETGELIGRDGNNYGTLVLNPDGSYSYTKPAGESFEGEINVPYTIEDGDGDKSSAHLIVAVNDAEVKIIGGAPGLYVDEAWLTADRRYENDGTQSRHDDDSADKEITFTAKDGLRSVTIEDIDGNPVYLQLDKAVEIEGEHGRIRATLVDNGNGNYSVKYDYVLDNRAEHERNDGRNTDIENWDKEISFGVTVTDTDGDTAEAAINVTIRDDVPVLEHQWDPKGDLDYSEKHGRYENEEGRIEFDYGADGFAKITIEDEHGNTLTFDHAGEKHIHYKDGSVLEVTVDRNGSLSYTYNPSETTDDHRHHYTVTGVDGDGDRVSTDFAVKVDDFDPKPFGDMDTITVDESYIRGGSHENPGHGDHDSDKNWAEIDIPNGYSVDTGGRGWDFHNDDRVWTKEVEDGTLIYRDGKLYYVLNEANRHGNDGNADNPDTADEGLAGPDRIDLEIGLVHDDTGEKTTGTVTVNVEDDAPMLEVKDYGGHGDTVLAGSGDTVVGTITEFDFGADDGKGRQFLIDGKPAIETEDGWKSQDGKVVISGDKVSYIADGTEEAGEKTIIFTVKDADGDYTSDEIKFTVENPVPSWSVSVTGGEVHESALDKNGPQAQGTDKDWTTADDTDSTNDSDLSTTGTIDLNNYDTAKVVIDGTEIELSSDNEAPITAETDHGTVTLTPNGDGSYDFTYTLEHRVEHSEQGTVTDGTDAKGGLDIRVTEMTTSGGTVTNPEMKDDDPTDNQIVVVDDQITAQGPTLSITEPGPQDFYITIMLDTSPSMGPGRGDGYKDVLDDAILALKNMLTQYGELSNDGDVVVNLMTFDSRLHAHGAMSIQEAIDFLENELELGDNTNYYAPLDQAASDIENALSDPRYDGYDHKVYFVSDGDPLTGAPNSGPDRGQNIPTSWKELLKAHGDDLDIFTVGIELGQTGAAANLMKEIADGQYIDVQDGNELAAMIEETVSRIDGNLIEEMTGLAGADGVAEVYEFGGVQIDWSQYPNGYTAYLDADKNVMLTIWQNGDYEVTVSHDITTSTTYDDVSITLVDGDGDKLHLDVPITVTPYVPAGHTVEAVGESEKAVDKSVPEHDAVVGYELDLPEGATATVRVPGSNTNYTLTWHENGTITDNTNTYQFRFNPETGEIEYARTGGNTWSTVSTGDPVWSSTTTSTATRTFTTSQLDDSNDQGASATGRVTIGRTTYTLTYEGGQNNTFDNGTNSTYPEFRLNNNNLQYRNSRTGNWQTVDNDENITWTKTTTADTTTQTDTSDALNEITQHVDAVSRYVVEDGNVLANEAETALILASVTVNGVTLTFNDANEPLVFTGDGYTLTVRADGTYDYDGKTGILDVEYIAQSEYDSGLKDSATLHIRPGEVADHSGSIAGTDAGEIIKGGDDDNAVKAGAGEDVVYGGKGDDSLEGDAGNDVLYGEAGKDLLNGGEGDDILFGGLEADTLFGGEGCDIFAWKAADLDGGKDTILDFELGSDKLLFESLMPESGELDVDKLVGNGTLEISSVGDDHLTLTVDQGAGGEVTVDINLASGSFADYDLTTEAGQIALLESMIKTQTGN